MSHLPRRGLLRRGAWAAALLGVAGIVAGPGITSASAGSSVHLVSTTPAATGTLSSITWDLPGGEPTTLDYAQSADYSPDIMVSNLCDDLLRLTPTFGIAPGIATSWKYTTTTTVVFQIRHGVKFWDGHTLTASDVAYSMLRNLNPKDDPLNGGYYASVKSIVATSPNVVTVTLSKPDELFVKEMATIAGAIAEKSYMAAKGKAYGTAAGGVMCSGPYELTKWNPGNDIVLTANPHYWDPAYTAKIHTVTVKFIVNSSTLTSALLSGEISGAYGVPAGSYPELKTANDGTLYFGPSLTITELAPTSTTGPIGNVKVREALSLALNRSAIASVIYGGAATPNLALTPATAWDPSATATYRAAYAKLGSNSANIAMAKTLVKSVPNHTAPITLALLSGDQTELALATAVQQAGTSIGLNIKLDQMQPLAFSNAFFVAADRKGIDMLVDEGYLDVPDPLDYTGLWFPKGALFDYTNYNNATVNSDLSTAQQTYNAATRAGLITQAQAIYMKDYIVIPVVNPDESLFLNKSITGAPASFAYIYEPCLAKLGKAG
ncbi:MAG: ABC transporter substrate-binding protein [Acidimicrobiales bacterium]